MKFIESYMNRMDARGEVIGIFREFPLAEINMVRTLAGHARGNHYHKSTNEFFIVLSGRLHLQVTTLKNEILFDGELSEGAMFIIEKNEIHTVTAISDVVWINGLDMKFSDSNPDFHIITSN